MNSSARIVLDTNVVLSAVLFATSRMSAVRRGWQQRRFIPLASPATARELLRALSYPKFKLSIADQRELFEDYIAYCEVVDVPHSIPDLPRCRDPHDLPFLALAITGNASRLVTGDRDLLILSDQVRFLIEPPGQFVDHLASLET